ncbi:MAG TPA: HD-GYP domain-containing protein [Dissulfurispiraceae bacterium]|nr:HD-GYP domain-containing protein [Dissulfurispiraceae bacterium]
MNKPRPQAIKEAKDIINRLAIMFKISQHFDVNNEAVVRSVDAFIEAVRPVINSENIVKIELLGEYFHFNDARVRYSVQYYVNFDFLIAEFRKRNMGSITLSGDINRRDLQDFIKAFMSCLTTDAPYITLKGITDAIETVDIGPLKHVKEDNVLDRRQTLRRTYFNAVSQLRSSKARVRPGEKVDLRRARLVVNSIIDLVMHEEQMMLSMAAIKDYDEYTYYHSVNVSILSLAVGMKLGLNRKKLSELGMAAFLHDIGKVTIPDEILNKPSKFDDREWAIMKTHPNQGLLIILSNTKMESFTIRSAIVAYDHHRNYDGSGYPLLPVDLYLDLYSNIVTIADRFDAMTSARVYSRVPRPPEEALRILLEGAGREVDPVLVRLFARVIGVFPIGTLVALDTMELGVVYRGNSEEPHRPMLIIIADSKGRKVDGMYVDLAERGLDGRYRRTIKKTLDANKYNLNISDYLFEAYS